MTEEDRERMIKKTIDAVKAKAKKDEAGKTDEGTAATDDGAEYADRPDVSKAEETDQAATADAAAAGSDSSDNTENSDAPETEDSSEDDKTKKSLFGKKDKKDKKDEQIAELNDKLLRNLAEFDNFRKRSEKEKAQMFEVGAKSIIEKILPALDNFERGLATVPEDQKDQPLAQGMEKIYKQLLTSLTDAGLTPIEAVGKEFDPNLHNAVMHEDNDAFGENTVSAELQKGYKYRDSVVRHSMVKVAN